MIGITAMSLALIIDGRRGAPGTRRCHAAHGPMRLPARLPFFASSTGQPAQTDFRLIRTLGGGSIVGGVASGESLFDVLARPFGAWPTHTGGRPNGLANVASDAHRVPNRTLHRSGAAVVTSGGAVHSVPQFRVIPLVHEQEDLLQGRSSESL